MFELKSSFILYTNYHEILKDLSDEDAGILFKAILEYKALGEIGELPSHLNLAFKFIKNQFDLDDKKYKEFAEKQKANGLKGGRPKKEENPKNPKNPTVFSETQKSLNDNDNDNVNDNVYIKENKTNILHISPKPKKEEIQKFAKEIMSKVDIDYFFQYYEASDWCDQYGARINWKQKLMNWSVKEKTKPKEATNGQQPYNPYL